MSNSGGNLLALVRHDLPAIPSGCVLDTATLRLYAGSSASGRTLQALRLNGSCLPQLVVTFKTAP